MKAAEGRGLVEEDRDSFHSVLGTESLDTSAATTPTPSTLNTPRPERRMDVATVAARLPPLADYVFSQPLLNAPKPTFLPNTCDIPSTNVRVICGGMSGLASIGKVETTLPSMGPVSTVWSYFVPRSGQYGSLRPLGTGASSAEDGSSPSEQLLGPKADEGSLCSLKILLCCVLIGLVLAIVVLGLVMIFFA